jgi:D-amino peptidase
MLDLWIDQINAIIESAVAEGVENVLVNEAHSAMNYLNIKKLHPKASLVTGYIKDDNQMHGLDESYLGAVFIGHAKPGTIKGVLNHGYIMRDVFDVRLNGESIGEIGLNALWAAYLGSALIMVVGDDKAAKESRDFNPSISCAIVKEGVSQFSAIHLGLENANQVIKDTVKEAIALRKSDRFFNISLPDEFEMEIDFTLSEMAHLCSFVPGVERTGGRTVSFRNNDYRELQHTRIVCTNLALTVVRNQFG